MRLCFLLAVLVAALSVAACQQQTRPPAAEQATPAAPAPPATQTPPPEQAQAPGDGEFKDAEAKPRPQPCSAARPANVNLTVQGLNGDAFRVIMTCNGQPVARCSAVVAAAPGVVGTASCSDGPHPAINGPANCALGVGNGNSPGATAPAWGCLN